MIIKILENFHYFFLCRSLQSIDSNSPGKGHAPGGGKILSEEDRTLSVPIITLISDFGLRDGYVASMKGVILGTAPDAKLVDISHEISPQAVRSAAFVLLTCYECFPQGTVHLAVVDPGVGTERRAIAVRSRSGFFIGPDNGIFSFVLARGNRMGSQEPRKRGPYGASPRVRHFMGGTSLRPWLRGWHAEFHSTFLGRYVRLLCWNGVFPSLKMVR